MDPWTYQNGVRIDFNTRRSQVLAGLKFREQVTPRARCTPAGALSDLFSPSSRDAPSVDEAECGALAPLVAVGGVKEAGLQILDV